MMQWQPIETAPKDGTPILGLFEYEPDGTCVIEMFWFEQIYAKTPGFWMTKIPLDEAVSNPAHWMPLPEPPPSK